MKIWYADMTNVNGQFNLFLTAENARERAMIEEIRRKLKPIDFAARQLDPSGTGEELLVIPLEHLIPTQNTRVVDGLAAKRDSSYSPLSGNHGP